MLKFVMHLLGYFVTIGLSICIMIFGWGLTPISWGWIIGGGIAGSVLGAVIALGGDK